MVRDGTGDGPCEVVFTEMIEGADTVIASTRALRPRTWTIRARCKSCPHRRSLAAKSGGFTEVGEIRMAFTVRAAVRGLAAIPERRKIARIAARPTAGTRRQVDDG